MMGNCQCKAIRTAMCIHITNLINTDTTANKKTIFNMSTVSGTIIANEEIDRILEIHTQFTTPDGMTPTSEVLEDTKSDASVHTPQDKTTTPGRPGQPSLPPSPGTSQGGNDGGNGHNGDGHHQCHICSEVFTQQRELTTHIDAIHPTIYICTRCDQHHKTMTEKEQHKNLTHYKCTQCEKEFIDIDQLGQHIYDEHEGEHWSHCTQHDIQCDLCVAAFETEDELEQHKERAHPKCNVCNKRFRDSKTIQDHWKALPDHKHELFTYACQKCKPPQHFKSALYLLNHDQRTHRTDDRDPIICLICEETVQGKEYRQHIRHHPQLYSWNMKGHTCKACPRQKLESVAAYIEHMAEVHPQDLTPFIMATKNEMNNKRYERYTREEAAKLAIQADVKGFHAHQCNFQGCYQEFTTNEDLKHHTEEHICTICGHQNTSPRDTKEHMLLHMTTSNKAAYTCEKCGIKLATLEELTAHKNTHKKYSCSKCRSKFTSHMAANKHELTCMAENSEDVFMATGTNDPLLVTMQCMSSMVNAGVSGIDPTITNLIRDQLAKAKSALAQKGMVRKNHNKQRTFTFLKLPTFGPSNTVTSYTERDTSGLVGKEFSGQGTAEENYTKLLTLTEAINRLVKSRNLTQDVGTELLLQHLKSPAKDFADSFKEEFEIRYGADTIPEYEDLILYLESNFVNIRPNHAKEQLLALKRYGNESYNEFYIRAWRCSHFASFTTDEAKRNSFRLNTVKEVVLRNLSTKNRALIEEEELERAMRNEDPFNPRELVEHLSSLKAQRDSMDADKRRPDYTQVGQLSTNIHQIKPDNPTNRGRQRYQTITHRNDYHQHHNYKRTRDPTKEPPYKRTTTFNKQGKPTEIRTTEQRTHTDTKTGERTTKPPLTQEQKEKWTARARQLTGNGCFRCGREGHGAPECKTYSATMPMPCRTCKTGYHNTFLCKSQSTPYINNKGHNVPRRSTQFIHNKTNSDYRQTGRGGYKQTNIGLHRHQDRKDQRPTDRGGHTTNRGQHNPWRGRYNINRTGTTDNQNNIGATGANKTPIPKRGAPNRGRTRGSNRGTQGRKPFMKSGNRVYAGTDPAEEFLASLRT